MPTGDHHNRTPTSDARKTSHVHIKFMYGKFTIGQLWRGGEDERRSAAQTLCINGLSVSVESPATIIMYIAREKKMRKGLHRARGRKGGKKRCEKIGTRNFPLDIPTA